jgi:hypothetical protein
MTSYFRFFSSFLTIVSKYWFNHSNPISCYSRPLHIAVGKEINMKCVILNETELSSSVIQRQGFLPNPRKVSILGDTPQQFIAHSVSPRFLYQEHSRTNICVSSNPLRDSERSSVASSKRASHIKSKNPSASRLVKEFLPTIPATGLRNYCSAFKDSTCAFPVNRLSPTGLTML